MCEYGWCVTAHTATSHPADEDHRSPGIAVPARVRGVGSQSAGNDVELEVGILRRVDDEQSWLVIDAGEGIGIEIALDDVRRIVKALLDDGTLRAATDR